MKRITRALIGAALGAGLPLTGGLVAIAAEDTAAVVESGNACQSELTMTERTAGYVEYELTATCLQLELRVQARAVTTFESADGVRREVATSWITRAPGSAGTTIVTQARAVDTRIEYRRSPA
ncbi:hypothetical protein [Agromyces silvae]|uniref:hypothetical protein n=1 Tax=Agromyces silvae TaxID=3388266 RepID=UPI00280B671F|nr:hypothetical protein [Agromyces protaetiae]